MTFDEKDVIIGEYHPGAIQNWTGVVETVEVTKTHTGSASKRIAGQLRCYRVQRPKPNVRVRIELTKQHLNQRDVPHPIDHEDQGGRRLAGIRSEERRV